MYKRQLTTSRKMVLRPMMHQMQISSRHSTRPIIIQTALIRTLIISRLTISPVSYTHLVAGSAVAGKRAERKNTASKENRGNATSSMGQRAGSKVGAVLDTKNKVKDKANAVKENIKDMPTQTAYAVYSAKEKAKSSVSDFKRGICLLYTSGKVQSRSTAYHAV